VKKEIDSEVLNRYLNGHHTPGDYQQVKAWFGKTGQTEQLDGFIHQNWQEFKEQLPGKDLNFILQKIQRQIYLNEKRKKTTLWHFYRQVAAVLLFPVLLVTAYLFINNNNFQDSAWAEIHSPVGARTQFQLPDGTSGWLNSSSSIRYEAGFKNREVKITGEAYFDVAKKNGEQFIVQTAALDITVLGTKFNVAAYPEDNFTEVVLEEGKVKLDGKNRAFSELLSPAERFVLYSNQKMGEISKVDASIHSAWKDGKLVFRDEPLSGVLKKMERWYSVQFVMEDEQLKNHIYQATFKDETLEEVLRLLAFTAPISYEIQDRKLNRDGTYSTKTIIIRKKTK
jgi:ferric-dicitrate binding protein FerR (iron transport regulator)